MNTYLQRSVFIDSISVLSENECRKRKRKIGFDTAENEPLKEKNVYHYKELMVMNSTFRGGGSQPRLFLMRLRIDLRLRIDQRVVDNF